MSLFEKAVISAVKFRMHRAFRINEMKEIEAEGVTEFQDIPYENRSGKKLMMDIFKPNSPDGTELPVIVNIHGGGLISGEKKNSEGFCKLLDM